MFTPETIATMLANPDAPFNLDEIEKAIFSSADHTGPMTDLAISGFRASFALIRQIGDEVYTDVDRVMRDNLTISTAGFPAEYAQAMENDAILRSARYARDQAHRQMFITLMQGALSAYEEGLRTS